MRINPDEKSEEDLLKNQMQRKMKQLSSPKGPNVSGTRAPQAKSIANMP